MVYNPNFDPPPPSGNERILTDAPRGYLTAAQIALLAGTSGLPLPTLAVTGAATIGGALTVVGLVTLASLAISGGGPTIVNTVTFTQPVAEVENSTFTTNLLLTANNAQDVLGQVSRMHVKAESFNQTSSHTTAFYGEASGFATLAGGIVSTLSAFIGVSGNQGLGTVTKGVDFYGHTSINSGGGALTNHYFLYQESSTAASNEYGGYLSAPLGIGTTAPSYNLDINGAAGANISATNWIRAGTGTGTLLVTSTGTTLFPGFSPGAGGFGATDIIVGNNGAANLTTATTAFLYISSCAGTPIGVPAKAAVGRIAMEYDTTSDKLWMYNGSAWKSVALT